MVMSFAPYKQRYMKKIKWNCNAEDTIEIKSMAHKTKNNNKIHKYYT